MNDPIQTFGKQLGDLSLRLSVSTAATVRPALAPGVSNFIQRLTHSKDKMGAQPACEVRMNDVQQYQQHARNCMALAGKTRDHTQAGQLLKIAEAWIKLAEQAEHREGNSQRA